MNDYILRNEKAQIVTVAPKDILFRYLKYACPDGEYSVEGPDADCTVYRKGGVLCPSSGSIGGIKVDPRHLKECQDFFQRIAGVEEQDDDFGDEDDDNDA